MIYKNWVYLSFWHYFLTLNVILQVEFVKDYVEAGNHQGIRYRGSLQDVDRIAGQYSFLYKKLFIRLNVTEDFEMTLKH